MKYLKIALVIGIIFVIAKSIYDENNKSLAKAQRLPCHSQSVVFEKVHAPELVKELQNALRVPELALSTQILASQHMPSRLFDYLKVSDVEQKTREKLSAYSISSPVQKAAKIEITIYENDKLDPGKKNAEAKLYAGYLIYNFYLDTSLVYKIQIDFMDLKAADVEEKIICAIDSVMSL